MRSGSSPKFGGAAPGGKGVLDLTPSNLDSIVGLKLLGLGTPRSLLPNPSAAHTGVWGASGVISNASGWASGIVTCSDSIASGRRGKDGGRAVVLIGLIGK